MVAHMFSWPPAHSQGVTKAAEPSLDKPSWFASRVKVSPQFHCWYMNPVPYFKDTAVAVIVEDIKRM